MAKRNALRDVDPVAITICKQGANRKRIFLKKDAEREPSKLLELPPVQGLYKTADWSAFYCVVAEPGAEEDPGMTGDPESIDVWESEDEIRKAAHRLMKNKGYVNLMHDALEAEGCSLVENAVALADFEIEGPDGEVHTIKKGSWYIACEPNDDAKAQIDAGEFTGVSLEGTGIRVEIEKAGEADRVSAASRKKLSGIIAKYRKAPHPWRACMRDNKDRFAKPEAVCGVLKKLAGRSHDLKKASGDKQWVDALVKAGVNDDNVDDFCAWCVSQRELAEADGDEIIQKATTFGEVIAERELTDSLWRAWSALEGVIYAAFRDEDEQDPKGVVRTSLAEFEAYLLAKLEAVSDDPEGLAKEVCTLDPDRTEEENMGLAEDVAALKKNHEDSLASIKKEGEATTEAVKGLVGLTEKLVDRVEALSSAGGGDDEEGKAKPNTIKKAVEAIGNLADKMDEFDSDLTGIAKAVRELGQGGSSQDDDEDEERDRLRKRQQKDPLAGLLA